MFNLQLCSLYGAPIDHIQQGTVHVYLPEHFDVGLCHHSYRQGHLIIVGGLLLTGPVYQFKWK